MMTVHLPTLPRSRLLRDRLVGLVEEVPIENIKLLHTQSMSFGGIKQLAMNQYVLLHIHAFDVGITQHYSILQGHYIITQYYTMMRLGSI